MSQFLITSSLCDPVHCSHSPVGTVSQKDQAYLLTVSSSSSSSDEHLQQIQRQWCGTQHLRNEQITSATTSPVATVALRISNEARSTWHWRRITIYSAQLRPLVVVPTLTLFALTPSAVLPPSECGKDENLLITRICAMQQAEYQPKL